jgi:aminopeptidase-like protein/aminoglycoside N3'-acetyltransferase
LDALRSVGLRPGDTAFVHVSLEELGAPEGISSPEARRVWLLDTLREAVGAEGTLLVPTYTFSFCRQELFDVEETPTEGGSASRDFLEFFRRQPGAVRSRDPIYSVAALGPQASKLLSELPGTCFGPGSLYARLLAAGGKVCAIGSGFEDMTFLDHVEELAGVPFRYQKLFTGVIRERGVDRKQGWLSSVRIQASNGQPDRRSLEAKARAAGVCRAARLGDGQVLAVGCRDFFDLTRRELEKDPWFTAHGPACDPVQAEDERIGTRRVDVALPPEASMEQMIEALWQLPRHLVSDGFDDALRALGTQLPMEILEYPTGTECWTWIIPEKWTCHEAYLETMDGKRLFSAADHPLHVVNYSLPFEGVVTRDELFRHLHVHPRVPEAIPFILMYYEREWGLCCSQVQKDALRDERYRVVIKTSFTYSTLKIGEIVIPGSSDESIVLCSHLDHPAQVNDDLTGVVVGMEVARQLLKRKNLRYTYRYLILPETIGGVAYLSQNESLLPKLKGGLFLEMLGLENPHALQLSYDGATELDACFSLALAQCDPSGWTGAYRTVIGNDERQFNGPGVRIPMLSLSRVLPPGDPNWPYRVYHSNYDDPSACSSRSLKESVELTLRMIDNLERNAIPVNKFKGEAFCSRYGVFVNPYTNPKGNRMLFNIMDRIDGTQSIAGIAQSCRVPFDATYDVVEELRRQGLVG